MLAPMIIFHHCRIVREIAHFSAQERTTLVIVGKVRISGTKFIPEWVNSRLIWKIKWRAWRNTLKICAGELSWCAIYLSWCMLCSCWFALVFRQWFVSSFFPVFEFISTFYIGKLLPMLDYLKSSCPWPLSAPSSTLRTVEPFVGFASDACAVWTMPKIRIARGNFVGDGNFVYFKISMGISENQSRLLLDWTPAHRHCSSCALENTKGEIESRKNLFWKWTVRFLGLLIFN